MIGMVVKSWIDSKRLYWGQNRLLSVSLAEFCMCQMGANRNSAQIILLVKYVSWSIYISYIIPVEGNTIRIGILCHF
jgi:hypothetical protein